MRKQTEKDLKVMSYRGVDVFLSAGTNPRFWATAGGLTHFGGSWDTLRKKLDAAVGFEPFDALQVSYDRGKGYVDQIRIIGLALEDSSWVVEGTGRSPNQHRIKFYHSIFPLSARDRLELYLGNMEQWEREEEAIKAGKASENAELEKLKLPRPDGG